MSRRRYHSPIREAQVEQTREAILEATEALLLEIGFDAISIPKVAKQAGVSAPTVYKHFPTLDDLMFAFIEAMRPRLGLSLVDLLAAPPEDVPELPVQNYRRYERHRDLLRRVMSSSTWHRLRAARPFDPDVLVPDAYRGRVDAMSEDDLRAGLAAIYLFLSPRTWRWLRETWGLKRSSAVRAAAWAMSVLARELGKNPPNLDPVPLEPEEP